MKNLLNIIKKFGKKTKRFIVKEIWLILYLLPYLARFIILFAGHPHFCFIKNLTVGFGIGGTKSRDANVAIKFFK